MRIALVFITLFSGVSGTFSQYLNQVNETEGKMEYTYNYSYSDGSLYSVSSIFGDSVDQLGYNYVEFKKYDADHNPILQTHYWDTTNTYTLYHGAEYLDGFFYVGGTKGISPNYDSLRSVVLKYDTLGSVVWEKELFPGVRKVRVLYSSLSDSSILFSGNIQDSGFPGAVNTFVVEMDSSGNVLWQVEFLNKDESPLGLVRTSDNGLVLSTYSQLTADIKTWVYKLDSVQNIEWSKILGPNDRDHYLQFFELPSGNFLGVGHSEEPSTGFDRAWLVELDKDNGQVLKDTVYWFADKYSAFNEFSNILFRNDDFVLIGTRSANASGANAPYHSLVISMNYDYSINWEREYFYRTYSDGFYNLFEKDDFIYLQGLTFQDDASNTNDEWFLVIDSLGCDDQWCTVGIDENNHEDENVLSVYPNPNNGYFWIELSETINEGELQITDLAGKVIRKVIYAGDSAVNVGGLPNGVYLIQLISEDSLIDTKKVIVSR